MEIEGAVLGDELHVVVLPGMPKHLDNRGPGRVYVRAESGLVSVQFLSNDVGPHEASKQGVWVGPSGRIIADDGPRDTPNTTEGILRQAQDR